MDDLHVEQAVKEKPLVLDSQRLGSPITTDKPTPVLSKLSTSR